MEAWPRSRCVYPIERGVTGRLGLKLRCTPECSIIHQSHIVFTHYRCLGLQNQSTFLGSLVVTTDHKCLLPELYVQLKKLCISRGYYGGSSPWYGLYPTLLLFHVGFVDSSSTLVGDKICLLSGIFFEHPLSGEFVPAWKFFTISETFFNTGPPELMAKQPSRTCFFPQGGLLLGWRQHNFTQASDFCHFLSLTSTRSGASLIFRPSSLAIIASMSSVFFPLTCVCGSERIGGDISLIPRLCEEITISRPQNLACLASQ